MKVFSELRKRGVLKVATIYLGADIAPGVTGLRNSADG